MRVSFPAMARNRRGWIVLFTGDGNQAYRYDNQPAKTRSRNTEVVLTLMENAKSMPTGFQVLFALEGIPAVRSFLKTGRKSIEEQIGWRGSVEIGRCQ